jgi:drug/metabolite transporter (DMT)-like permease
VPRIRPVDLMLAGVVVLWALNVTLSKYILEHGFEPLVYSAFRYGGATLIFVGISGFTEKMVRLRGRHALAVALVAAALLYVNQITFVYALRLTTASTVGLIFGVTPIVTALIAFRLGMERPTRRFAAASAVSFAGVALVALGSGGGLSGDLKGDLLGLVTAITWGGYSVAVAVLMRSYSPVRISAGMLPLMAVPIAATAIPQLGRMDYGAVSAWVWFLFAVAVLGPLVITNLLWFTALDRVGPSQATLFNNFQPFVAVLFAVLLLSERLTAVQIGGGALIAVGVVLAWRRQLTPVQVE